MSEQYQSILRKLERSSPTNTSLHLQQLKKLCQSSTNTLQSKYSMQIVTVLNQILATVEIPCSKILILEIMCSIVEKCKSMTPRALYQLDLAVKLLGDDDSTVRQLSQIFLYKYIQSYMRMDDILLAYIQGKQYYGQQKFQGIMTVSFHNLIKTEPKSVNYCEDDQLIIDMIKQLLEQTTKQKMNILSEQTLKQLVNNTYFLQIYRNLPKDICESLQKYFTQKVEIPTQTLKEFEYYEFQNLKIEYNANQQNTDQTYLLETSVASAFRSCHSDLSQSSKSKKSDNSTSPHKFNIVDLNSYKGMISSKIFKGLDEYQKYHHKNQYFNSEKLKNKNNNQSYDKQNFDTSTVQVNPILTKPQLFGSTISLLEKQQAYLPLSNNPLVRKSSFLCSVVASPAISLISSQQQIMPPITAVSPIKPINPQIQTLLQQIIDKLQNQDLPWDKKKFFLNQFRSLLKNNTVSYFPDKTQAVLIDLCYDNRLNNCLLAFWGLQHLSECYYQQLKQKEEIESTCLMKLSDINIYIRNASRKVLYTFGLIQTLEIVKKLFQKYSSCSHYRKKQVLQLIAQLSNVMKQQDATKALSFISKYINDANPEQHRTFLKIMYFQNQRFGPHFKKQIHKHLKQSQINKYNQLIKPSAIFLSDPNDDEIKTVVEIDQSGSEKSLKKQQTYLIRVIDPVIEQQNQIQIPQQIKNIQKFTMSQVPNNSFRSDDEQEEQSGEDELDEILSQTSSNQQQNSNTQISLHRSLKKSVSAMLKIPPNISIMGDITNLRRKSQKDQTNYLKPPNARRNSKRGSIMYVKKQDLIAPPTPQQIFTSLLPRMKDKSNWKNQYESLNDLRALFHLRPQFRDKILDNFNTFFLQIIKMISSHRSSLSKTAIITIQQFCQYFCKQMQPHLQPLFNNLLKKTLCIHEFIVDEVNKCFTFLCKFCSSTKIINALYTLFLSKNIQIKSEILYCIQLLSDKKGIIDIVSKQPKSLIILQYLTSSSNQKLKSGFERIVNKIPNLEQFKRVQQILQEQYYYQLVDKFRIAKTQVLN